MHYQVIHHTPGRLRVRCGRGMFNHDQACGIECRLLKLKGVSSVKATPCNGGVFILYEGANPQTIFRVLDRLRPETLRSHEPEERAEARKLGQSFSLKIAGKVSSFLLCKLFLPPPLRMAKAFWNYGSYFRRGMAGLGSGRLNVAVLDAVSIGVSIGTRAYGTANSIMFLLSISDLLENYTRKKTRAALAASLSINVDQVWRVEKDGMRQVPMEQIRPGDKIRVDAGNVIPVDGAVLSGEAEVNQAAMTGESEAAAKQEGSVVFAGTTLETGSLVIRVDAMGDQSRINNIIALIDHSEELKARIQSRAEKLADSIVPLTLLTAGALFLFTRNISKALSVLMVDYSCAIKLATPISVISAMKEASARKIMIKGGKFMELFARADTIVFDKTGTLTEGEPRVVAVLPEPGMNADELVEMAAALEQGSEHPVGKAVYEHARLLELPIRAVADLSVVPGRGISGVVDGVPYAVGNPGFMQDKGISWKEEEGRLREFMRQGASPLYVGRGDRPAGVIMVADSLKPDSRAAVDYLKRMNLRVVMLTGDNAATARHMAGELHIDEVISDVLPDEKASHVMKMEERGDKVAMVGDGVNDAPALACARVGISMKSGTELAMESSDIVLMKSNPVGVAEALQLGRTTLHIIRQNLFWAFFYNIIGIPLAAGCLYPAFGLTLNPMIAAGAMSLSSLCVVFNSLRLRGFKPRLEK